MYLLIYKSLNFSVPAIINYSFLIINYLYPCSWTLLMERPDGSFMFLKAASHSSAISVLQATDGTEGTHREADFDGKKSVKIVR